MDIRAENRGRPHQKVRFSAAPVTGRNFLTLGRPGVRVRNVRGNPDQKIYVYAVFFFPECQEECFGKCQPQTACQGKCRENCTGALAYFYRGSEPEALSGMILGTGTFQSTPLGTFPAAQSFGTSLNGCHDRKD